MRLGLLTTSFPSDEDETSGAFVEDFARAMIRRGHTVHVLAPHPARSAKRRDVEGLDVSFLDYAPAPLRRTFHGAGVLDNVRATPLAWPGLATYPLALAHAARTLVASWDAIVSHFALPCALVAAGVRGHRPHLAITHSADLHLLSKLPARRMWARAIEDGATAMWFVSSRGHGIFTRALGAPMRAPSMIAPMGIEAPEAPTSAANEAFTVLFVGRLVTVKGVDVLVDALEGVGATVMHIVGDGPLRRELEARARARGIEATFHGTLATAAKWRSIALADVVVLPSRVLATGRTEGAPVVALEAMAMGKPLIVSDVGGLPELAGDAALYVPADDPHALRRALTTLRDDVALREKLGVLGRARAAQHTWAQRALEAESLLFGAPGRVTPQG
jgi:glycosyltransferase involved in cell wall biosynthesis